MRARLHKKGSSTIEIMIAFAILMLTLSAVVLVVFGGQSTSVDTQTNNEALYRAQTMLEGARAASRTDFSTVVSQGTVVEQSGTLSYSKKLDVANIDDFTKQATSTITWKIGGQDFIVALSTMLTNPQGALGGDTCSPTLTGDWTHPKLLGNADVGGNNGGTDVDVVAKKAYVTANSSSASKPDLYIIDVSDPNIPNLPIFGSVNTGPGLAAVAKAGKYAYVANISTVSQLQVIDVSVPSAPALVKSLKVTGVGDTAIGNSIFYDNKKVYLGLTKSAGNEFYVIDVSDPLNPSVKASFETNTQINEIKEKNNVAYIAVPDNPTSGTPEQLRVLDVSNADSGIITELTPFSYPNASTMSGQSAYLSKDGKTLYFGRGGANSAHNPDFFVLNVTNPSSITPINSKYIATSNDVTVNAVVVRSNLAFMITSDPNLGFQIWDLNNLGSATPYGSINVQQTSTGGMDCEGNVMYVAQRSNKALQIVGPS